MAVQQENKGKVRPVLDYRELNQFVSSQTAEGEGNNAKMASGGRESCPSGYQKGISAAACDESLWQFQIVKYKGFGLCSAPKIMSRIVAYVMGLDKEIAKATQKR